MERVCELVRRAMHERAVPDGYWTCGAFEDGRAYLVREGENWQLGFFERGRPAPYFRTPESEEAVRRFVDWVSADWEATRRGAEATSRWLEKHGRKRP